jgi:hypothetical protein
MTDADKKKIEEPWRNWRVKSGSPTGFVPTGCCAEVPATASTQKCAIHVT